MNILVIGGTRFLGRQLVWRLLARGDRVTLLNRGQIANPFPALFDDRIERLVGDRTRGDLARLVGARRFDAVVDTCAYTALDAQSALDAVGGRTGHYVFISTGQVYLVRTNLHGPAREEDYAGPTMEAPAAEPDLGEWRYGMDKRAAEGVLAHAHANIGFPATLLRLPMVHGVGDYYRRVEAYLWRLLDGGPLLLPESADRPMRHVSAPAASAAIAALLGNPHTFGRAFNLAQDETPTLREFVQTLAGIVGTTANLVIASPEERERANLAAGDLSPLSGRWMSFIDPSRARSELGFVHEPVREYLAAIVSDFQNHPPHAPPSGYARRSEEVALAERLLNQHAPRATL